jgi:hypothetical protein
MLVVHPDILRTSASRSLEKAPNGRASLESLRNSSPPNVLHLLVRERAFVYSLKTCLRVRKRTYTDMNRSDELRFREFGFARNTIPIRPPLEEAGSAVRA